MDPQALPNSFEHPLEEYRKAVESAYKNGTLTKEGQIFLFAEQQRLGLSDQEARFIENGFFWENCPPLVEQMQIEIYKLRVECEQLQIQVNELQHNNVIANQGHANKILSKDPDSPPTAPTPIQLFHNNTKPTVASPYEAFLYKLVHGKAGMMLPENETKFKRLVEIILEWHMERLIANKLSNLTASEIKVLNELQNKGNVDLLIQFLKKSIPDLDNLIDQELISLQQVLLN